MSAIAIPSRPSIRHAVEDGLAIAGRNLITLRRVPQLLVFSTIQPILFVLLFRYVFGGAIQAPPGVRHYVDYLMPGVFIQTVTFGGMNTGIGLAEDLNKGLIERFRSLPMARSAVLTGRTAADLVRNTFVILLMCAVGFAVGFRVHTGVLQFLAGVGILLLFAFGLSWMFATVGLMAANAETAQAAMFPLMAPLVFASSAFVPIGTMPGWLQAFARHQPVTIAADAARGLMIGYPSTTHHVLASIAWTVGLVALFAPLAVARYRRTA